MVRETSTITSRAFCDRSSHKKRCVRAAYMRGLRVWTIGASAVYRYHYRVQHLHKSVEILIIGRVGTYGAGGPRTWPGACPRLPGELASGRLRALVVPVVRRRVAYGHHGRSGSRLLVGARSCRRWKYLRKLQVEEQRSNASAYHPASSVRSSVDDRQPGANCCHGRPRPLNTELVSPPSSRTVVRSVGGCSPPRPNLHVSITRSSVRFNSS